MADQSSWGRLIRQRRRALDLTQADLARRIGYSVITVRKVESEERRPSRQLAERLAQHLDLTAAEQQAFVRLVRSESARPLGPYLSHQLRHGSGPGPPRTLTSPPTRLIGRESEVAAVGGLLLDPAGRLVTLVGPPGIGKSRLAVEVARASPGGSEDGVYLVALAPLADPALIAARIAEAVAGPDLTAGSPADALVELLRERRVLLLLDNAEHLLAGVSVVAEILAACPGVRVLATSRAPLHLRGERQVVVPALALPPPGTGLTAAAAAGYAAVELFVERAQAADPQFTLTDGAADDVAAVCTGVDGVPLSIELVAARTRLLPPPALRARLDDRLALLTNGPRDLPPRQQTLRAALDWSYDLLDPGPQALLARLSVFAGGCTLAAAEQVANAGADLPVTVLDGLAGLTDNHLLQQETRPGGERYFVFLETTRAYALERLRERGEGGEFEERYVGYYLHLADRAGRELTGGQQEVWFARLEAEHDNLRAVLDWLVRQGRVDPALRLCASLWQFWHIRSHRAAALRDLTRVLELAGRGDPLVRAQVLDGAGWIALDHHGPGQALVYFDQSLTLFRTQGCRRGEAATLHGVAAIAQSQERYDEAAHLLDRSLTLYRELGDDEGTAWTLDHLGMVALGRSEHHRAEDLFATSLARFRALRHAWGTAILLHHAGLAALARERPAQARQSFEEARATFQELASGWGVVASLVNLGHVCLAEGDRPGAAARFGRALALAQAHDDWDGLARALLGMAGLAVAGERHDHAGFLLGAVAGVVDAGRVRLHPLERAMYDRTTAAVAARAAVGPVAAALARGRAVPRRTAVAEALVGPGDRAGSRIGSG
jgi:predicted ATPase/transcriptional regulator with XRE-family HTH domain